MWGWVLMGASALLLCSSKVRGVLFRRCLFPLGYALSNSRIVGYTAYKALFMSSAAKASTPHSLVAEEPLRFEGGVQVVLIPLLEDNFSYLILHESSRTAVLVDPADPYPVTQVLAKWPDFKLGTILTTHKHWDHAGGNLELAKQFADLRIVGGKGDDCAGATLELSTGDRVNLGAAGFEAEVFACPCHTRGHVIYRVAGKLLFTGDTLFAGGCGKFFEGNAAEMYRNLHDTIGSMSDDTLIFPGHEYTLSNLEFGAWVEPGNAALQAKLQWAKERRAGRFPTVPTTLSEEKAYNPFMRVHEPAVRQRVARVVSVNSGSAASDSAEAGAQVMDALRTLKNENAHKKK